MAVVSSRTLVDDLLATLPATTAETIRAAPTSTIVPAAAAAIDAVTEALARSALGAGEVLRIGPTLGEGGMGVVRLAEQVALGRTVAVKSLRPDRRDPASALDLLREAWITGSLEHPNIVPVHHVEADAAGHPVVVLKRIEGTEWSSLLGDADAVRARFGHDDLLAWNLEILLHVCNALRFAHSRGVVHRDIKPSNVMIGSFGEVYLLDWGLAVSTRDDGSGRLPLARNATEMAGTPGYMAPEMLGGADITPATDVYLVGSVLAQLISGRPPHRGRSVAEVVASVVASSPELPADAPPELAAICRQAMAASPADRFATIDDLRRALVTFLALRGVARLVTTAEQRLRELRALASGDQPDRHELYRLFGACRFGFLEALVTAPEHAGARAGLRAASVAVAEFELAAGSPQAALDVLAELEGPPPELAGRAEAAAAAARARQAKLEALRHDYDETVGARTRTFLALILGVVFTTSPLLGAAYPQAVATPRHLVLWSLAALVLLVALGVWARHSLSKTVVNRRLFGSYLFLFVMQAGLWAQLDALGVSVETGLPLTIALWAVVAGLVALGIDRRVVPMGLGFVLGAAVATARPSWALYVAAVCNVGFTINAVVAWRPTTWTRSEEERLRQKAEEQQAAAARRARRGH